MVISVEHICLPSTSIKSLEGPPRVLPESGCAVKHPVALCFLDVEDLAKGWCDLRFGTLLRGFTGFIPERRFLPFMRRVVAILGVSFNVEEVWGT